jgi:hypothetical protein
VGKSKNVNNHRVKVKKKGQKQQNGKGKEPKSVPTPERGIEAISAQSYFSDGYL